MALLEYFEYLLDYRIFVKFTFLEKIIFYIAIAASYKAFEENILQ